MKNQQVQETNRLDITRGALEALRDETTTEVLKSLSLFHTPGECFEVCVISPRSQSGPWTGRAFGKKATVTGWFNNLEKAAELIAKSDKLGAAGIYHVLNPVDPALLGRACNRLEAGVSRTTDQDVTLLRWLLVDADPERPAGISSTDHEHARALELSARIEHDLTQEGWAQPIRADSGNGGHLVYRLPDLPNTDDNVQMLSACLNGLACRYDAHGIKINTKCFNPSRLCKVYGTMTGKGDSLHDRPHRRSRLLSWPTPAGVQQ